MVWLRGFLLIACLLGLVQGVMAADHIIVNSQDWRDVYTGTQYGYLTGTPSNFLVSTRHSTILLYSIPVDREEILVLSNQNQPFIAGYDTILQSRGYSTPEEIRSNNLNLILGSRLEDVNSFIILDDAYGYNAISVAPYAVASRSFVIFANEDNIDEVVDLLEEKNPASVLIYGQVDREVKDALEPFSPDSINFGNRFDNNIEIVRRYLEIKPTKQVVLSNGEFIEAGLMSGSDPVLFLGRQNVPESVRNFITESDIEVGILIGNELVNSATFIRRQLGISVFVKFAQGARQPTGSIATVEDLDRFPMPRYDLQIEVSGIVYNKATGSLEVTYHNPLEQAEYFKSTITIRDDANVVVIGDPDAVFLDKSEYKTIVYSSDIDGNPLNFQSEELSGDIFVTFGEGPKSLENTYQQTFEIDIIEVLDDSNIEIREVSYDTLQQQFMVTIENTGDTRVFVSVELVDLVVNGEQLTVGSADTVRIDQGKSTRIPVEVEMSEEDLADNSEVRVRAYYGERELSRIKIKEATLPLSLSSGYVTYALYGVGILLILFLLGWLGTKKKCKHCGHMNPRGRKTCQKCGASFKGNHKPHHPPPSI